MLYSHMLVINFKCCLLPLLMFKKDVQFGGVVMLSSRVRDFCFAKVRGVRDVYFQIASKMKTKHSIIYFKMCSRNFKPWWLFLCMFEDGSGTSFFATERCWWFYRFWPVLGRFEGVWGGIFFEKSEFGVRCVPGVVSHRVVYITEGCIQRQGFDTWQERERVTLSFRT